MTSSIRSDEAVRLQAIHKWFPGVHALKGVDFGLSKGEIRGLVGENGAGKSTLMNVLGGVLQPDSGTIIIDGQEETIETPKKAETLGVSFIHQELSLFENLDVASNIFIHQLPNRGAFLDKRALYREAGEILKRVGLSQIRPRELVKNLQMGQRQLVEIAQCLTQSAKILILDEPTSSLTKKEINTLFEIVRSLRQTGVSIVFISHRLNEIYQICDTITVMRDGQNMETKSLSEISQANVVRLMIGREMSEMYDHSPATPGKPLLRVEKLSRRNKFSNISFSLREGEIVGLYGLMGSGRTELVRSIFGLDPYDEGKVYIEGEESQIHSPERAIEKGLALITENRREEGLDIIHSVQANLVLASLHSYRNAVSVMDKTKEREVALKNIEALNIKTSSPRKVVRYLSGGNQQKVVIAKWLNTNPKVFMLDEPTRGIDVGAKKEIFKILDDLVRKQVGIFLISSELAEIMGMCDRILVIKNGSIVAELSDGDKTEENILSYAMGAK